MRQPCGLWPSVFPWAEALQLSLPPCRPADDELSKNEMLQLVNGPHLS